MPEIQKGDVIHFHDQLAIGRTPSSFKAMRASGVIRGSIPSAFVHNDTLAVKGMGGGVDDVDSDADADSNSDIVILYGNWAIKRNYNTYIISHLSSTVCSPVTRWIKLIYQLFVNIIYFRKTNHSVRKVCKRSIL